MSPLATEMLRFNYIFCLMVRMVIVGVLHVSSVVQPISFGGIPKIIFNIPRKPNSTKTLKARKSVVGRAIQLLLITFKKI
jgi:hypothetical protein